MQYKRINSLNNKTIKSVLRLYKSSERIKQSSVIVEGHREVNRALMSKYDVKEIFICFDYTNNEILKSVKNKNIIINECSKNVFDKISYRQNPDGVIGIFKTFFKDLNQIEIKNDSTFVVIENIEKPGNLGNIIRTSDAVNASGIIILNKKTDIYNPNVIRSSIGSLFSIPIINTDNDTFFKWAKKNKVESYATSPIADKNYTDVIYNKSIAIIFGSEDDGLTKEVINLSDHEISIPMLGLNDSLNVSSSVSIILYEILRQRNKLKV